MQDLTKYKRLFAFGCSFTQYRWPTWADILAQEIPVFYNYGRSGAGNLYMYLALIEAHTRHGINQDDLVVMAWTNCAREDRYVHNNWRCYGNIFTQEEYDPDWVKKFADLRGYFIRDMAVVQGTKLLLDSIGVDYDFFSMVPLQLVDQYRPDTMTDIADVESLYSNVLSEIKPSYYDIVFNRNWLSRNPRPKFYFKSKLVKDNHPTPLEHLEYLQKVWPTCSFKPETLDYVQTWNTKILEAEPTENPQYIKHPNFTRL
jgi:hypothetical protein